MSGSGRARVTPTSLEAETEGPSEVSQKYSLAVDRRQSHDGPIRRGEMLPPSLAMAVMGHRLATPRCP